VKTGNFKNYFFPLLSLSHRHFSEENFSPPFLFIWMRTMKSWK